MTDHIARIANLRFARGDFLLQVPTWEIPRGSVVAMVGHNGAGKSTLLEILFGVSPAYEGTVEVVGHEPRHAVAEMRQHVGYMTDDMPVFRGRVSQVLNTLSAYYRTWNHGLVKDLLDQFQLDHTTSTSRLSKGEATKFRLIIAMAHEPQLLLLDEPTVGLDLRARQDLLRTVMDTAKDPQRTVVLSSHNLTDLERIADHVLVLRDGRPEQQGPIESIIPDGTALEDAMTAWERP